MMKYLLFILLLFSSSFTTSAQFITTWKTDNLGSSDNQIIIPINGTGYEIRWWLKSDSTQVNGIQIASGNNFTLLLPQAGIYGLSISQGGGTLNYFRFNNTGDKLKLLEINQWGNHPWTTMQYAFFGCKNLTITATDLPNLTQVNNLVYMFGSCSQIEQIPYIENWDVSKVINMSNMFNGASKFNQPLNNWDVSKVTNMSGMFYIASKFDQPLNDWDVSNVTNMFEMFSLASSFNQSLSDWDVSKVTNMSNMFFGTSKFDRSLNDWDVSKVTNMSYMFSSASKFNQSLNNWDVSKVSNMSYMFSNATSFDQPLNNWNVSNVNNMSYMFSNATSFDQPLNNWNVSNVNNMNSMFSKASKFDRSLNDWDVSKVTNMSSMFFGASKFNQALNNWVVSNVTNMSSMFNNAVSFNQYLSDWDVSKVNNMYYMFAYASSFNQPLNKWDVSTVNNMGYMFYWATSFNQPLSDWDISKVTNMNIIFNSSGIDCANITRTLQGWAAHLQAPDNITLGADGINYAPQALDALNTLRNEKGWTINIGSEVACQQLPVTLVYFKATLEDPLVRLDWATSMQQDHDYFEVQRSVDALNWLSLTQIPGADNVIRIQNYTTIDPTPLTGISYYRLKMVDLDGSFAYSSIRAVATQKGSQGFLYPNPSQDIVTFRDLPAGIVRIYNQLGREVQQAYISPEKASISINELPAGTYILKMEHGWQTTLVIMP